jgi:hypothetical protein
MDGQDFRITLRPGDAGVNVQIPEIPAKPLMSFDIERLIAKEQYEVIRKRLMQVLDLAVAQRLRQIETLNLRADARRDRCNADGLSHGGTLMGVRRSFSAQQRIFLLLRVNVD